MTSPLTPPMPGWSNQDLIVFHGTTSSHQASILAGVRVAKGRARTDFGQGFYTTTDVIQAGAWAGRLSARVSGSSPVVIQFTLSRETLAGLESIWFARANRTALDYWSLVAFCRSGGASHGRPTPPGWYDVAVGPLAASVARQIHYPDSDQVSFHTPAAEAILNSAAKVVIP